MANTIQIPQGVADLVKGDGKPREITGVTYDGAIATGTAQYMIYLDDGLVRSVELAGWPAAQAELATKEADRQTAIQTRQEIVTALQGLAGRAANGTYTAKELQALIMALVHKAGGINKAGEIRSSGEWL
jgi:hypothetical protein